MNPTKAFPLLNHILYLVFLTSLICSFRAISSISIGLILVTGILTNRASLKFSFRSKPTNLFLAGCVLFYLLHIISLLYTHNIQESWNDIRIKTGLVITPLAVCCSGYINKNTRQKLFLHFSLILAIASLYCVGMAFLHYRQTNDLSWFFYHALVTPLKQHAVYFSIFIFISQVFLFETITRNTTGLNKPFHIGLLLFFSVFLFLLSSRLVIAIFLLYLLYYFIGFIKNNTVNRAMGIGAIVLLIGFGSLGLVIHNPVSKRFHEIMNGDIKLVERNKFDPGDYFNGLQFRLLQWKLVKEILDKKHSWLEGVSSGDAQYLLNQEYISKNMYIGDPARGDRGYLDYNTHNQFLETVLQSGLIGLFILLLICFSLLQMAWQKKTRASSFIIFLLIAWLLNESVFETQYGVLIFTFFPMFIGHTDDTVGSLQSAVSSQNNQMRGDC